MKTRNGRAIAIRSFGKISFIDVESPYETIQLKVLGKLKISRWDWISYSGYWGLSDKGNEVLICNAEDVKVEAFCEGDLPPIHDAAISEHEISQNPDRFFINNQARNRNLIARHKGLLNVRNCLNERGYIEVETPILSKSASGANANPFVTKDIHGKDLVLRIATEVHLKRAIVSGFDKVYEIGRIFRNEGIDKTHNPEFTSIEIYTCFNDLEYSKSLLLIVLHSFELFPEKTKTFTYQHVLDAYGEDFDKHLSEENTLYFITEQPIEDTPLCQKLPNGKANRFEAYMNGMEIANAYQEINNWKEQEERLETDEEGLVKAMKYGMPKLTGIGIGIDRLVMIATKENSIHNVIFS